MSEKSRKSYAPSARVYQVVRSVVHALARLLFRIEIHGWEHLPRTGPVIFAPTHRSFFDTPFLASVIREPARFLAKDSLFNNPVGNWAFLKLGGIPVDRELGGAKALRACLNVLLDGQSLVVFPEGTRRVGDRVGPLLDGCAYLAVKAQVPIVPIGIGGSEKVLPRGAKIPRLTKVRVEIGPPIVPDPMATRKDAPSITQDLEDALQRVYDIACAGRGDA